MDKVQKVIGVGQLIVAFFAGLATLGVIHPDPNLMAGLLGLIGLGGGVNKVSQPSNGH